MIKKTLHIFIFTLTFCFTASAQNSNVSMLDAETPKPDNSTIRGRVYYADTGRAVKRASIMLMSEDTPGGRSSAPSSLTDGEGNFLIKNVRGGTYYAIVNAPGVVSPLAFADFSEENEREGVKKGFSNFEKIIVDGVTNIEVQIPARRGGAIGGRVMYDDGDAAIGVKVEILRKIGEKFMLVIPNFSVFASIPSGGAMFQTDDRGVYRFSGLPAGEYIIKVTETANHSETRQRQYYDPFDSIFSSSSFLTIFYPDVLEKQSAQVINVEMGQELSEINLVIPSRNLYKLEGKLVSRRDKTPVMANVSIERKSDENIFSIGNRSRDRRQTALTDKDGNWKFKEMPKGTYKVTVEPIENDGEYRGYQDGYPMNAVNRPSNTVRNPPPKPKFAKKVQEITIEDKDQTELIFEMGYGAKISGVVTVENSRDFPRQVSIIALDENSETVGTTGVWVSEYSDEGTVERSVKNDFEFDNLPEGKTKFSINSSDDGFYVKSAVYNSIDLLSAPINLGEGEILRNVKIVFGTDVGTLKGKVLDDNKEAVKNAKLTLIPVDALKRKNSSFYKSVSSDEGGEFETKLAPGEYAVMNLGAMKESPDFYKWLDENIGDALKVTIKPKEKTTLTIKLPKQ